MVDDVVGDASIFVDEVTVLVSIGMELELESECKCWISR